MISAVRYIVIFLFFSLFSAYAQAINTEMQSEKLLAAIKAKIDFLKKETGTDEALRLKVLKEYYTSEDDIEELILLEKQIQGIQLQLKNLPTETKKIEARIKKTESQLKKQVLINFSSYPTDELEQHLLIEKSNKTELEISINKLSREFLEQQKQRKIRTEIATIKNDQVAIQQKQKNLVLNVDKQVLEAYQTQLGCELRKSSEMLIKLELEYASYPQIEQKHRLELQLFELQKNQTIKNIDHIESFLAIRRQEEINDVQVKLLQAQKESKGKHPAIQEASKQNILYYDSLQKINHKLKTYLERNKETDALYQQLDKDFKSAEQKINLAGLSPALGNLLHEQRRKLPLIKKYQSTFDQIQEETALASLKLFQLEEANNLLSDTDQVIQSRILAIDANQTSDADKLAARAELRTLIINQKELVVKLTSMYSEYSRALAETDFSLHQLVSLGEKFNHFLNQRLLWVPNAPKIDQQYALDTFKSVLWFTKTLHWRQTLDDLKSSIFSNRILTFMLLLTALLFIRFKGRIEHNLQVLLKNCGKIYVDHFSSTFYALGYVLLLVLPFPLVMFSLGWLLSINGQATHFSHSVAQGLMLAAIPLLVLQFVYRLFKPNGLVETMFLWKKQNIQLLSGQFQWFRFVIVPTVFCMAFFTEDSYSGHSYILGRLAMIVAMLALSYLLNRLAHPLTGLAKDFYRKKPQHWLSHLRYFFHAIAVLIPLVIIGFAIMGYYQSGLELQGKLVTLLRLIFFTTLTHEIIMRAMLLANRQLALQNAKQKRLLKEQEENKEGHEDAVINQEEEALLDIPKINEQSKRLLNVSITVFLMVSFWITLGDVLPAFSIFDKVVLWQHMEIVDGKELLQPITMLNVIVCFLYLLLLVVFVKNFPGLIDMLFAGKKFMTAGSRYALIQLARYAVTALTIVAIGHELGGSWSQVQWLVAALSVGLGFGLQEIFANMVSGIILLFERPVRVGDTVTVGDITGKVSRIQMRATTLTDWDQKELIIPNKTFITDKLVNWTLSDTVTRIVIPVGIAYASDEELAIQVLKQVIDETPLILKDPAPSVYFLGFGDSSLDFELRVFVRELENRLPLTDELHRRINRAFKENKIEIPFPQRDLHIRSTVQADNSKRYKGADS